MFARSSSAGSGFEQARIGRLHAYSENLEILLMAICVANRSCGWEREPKSDDE